jgi:hypothetical protein
MAGGLKQIIVNPAGVPGANNSVFSALKTATVPSGSATFVITDIGLAFFMPNADANVTVEIQDPALTWTTIIAASVTSLHAMFLDGANIRIKSANTSTSRVQTYYLIQ